MIELGLDKFTVANLKEFCNTRGLESNGKKADLVQRLTLYVQVHKDDDLYKAAQKKADKGEKDKATVKEEKVMEDKMDTEDDKEEDEKENEEDQNEEEKTEEDTAEKDTEKEDVDVKEEVKEEKEEKSSDTNEKEGEENGEEKKDEEEEEEETKDDEDKDGETENKDQDEEGLDVLIVDEIFESEDEGEGKDEKESKEKRDRSRDDPKRAYGTFDKRKFRRALATDQRLRTLVVGPIGPDDLEKEEIRNYAKQTEVSSIKFEWDSVKEKHIGYVEFIFKAVEDRIEAEKEFPKPNEEFVVKHLTEDLSVRNIVEKDIRKLEDNKDSVIFDNKSLVAFNLPKDSTDEIIKGSFPDVKSMLIVKEVDDEEVKFKGIVYLHYESVEAAKEALEKFKKDKITLGEQNVMFDRIVPQAIERIPDKSDLLSPERRAYIQKRITEFKEKRTKAIEANNNRQKEQFQKQIDIFEDKIKRDDELRKSGRDRGGPHKRIGSSGPYKKPYAGTDRRPPPRRQAPPRRPTDYQRPADRRRNYSQPLGRDRDLTSSSPAAAAARQMNAIGTTGALDLLVGLSSMISSGMQRQQQNVRRGDTEDVPRSRGRDSSWSGGYSRLYDEGEPPNKRRMGMHDDSYNSRSTAYSNTGRTYSGGYANEGRYGDDHSRTRSRSGTGYY